MCDVSDLTVSRGPVQNQKQILVQQLSQLNLDQRDQLSHETKVQLLSFLNYVNGTQTSTKAAPWPKMPWQIQQQVQ